METKKTQSVTSGGPQPLVSAVIPTRNRPDLVCRAVRSALAQTYQNIEVVVVIDGPDPATASALESFRDPRIRIVALQENVGGSEARNIGVRNARGEYIALLDDDDEWLPEKTSKQVDLILQSNSRALITSRYFARRADGQEICFPLRFPKRNRPISEYMFASFSGFQTSTFLCRRTRFLECPFTSGLGGCQDLDWFLRMMSHPRATLEYIREPLAIFHVPESRPSVSRDLSWKFRLDWGRSRRALMTGRGYSDFILRVCLEKMLSERFSACDVLAIIREYLIEGTPTLFGGVQLATALAVPKSVREKMRRLRIRSATAFQGAVRCT